MMMELPSSSLLPLFLMIGRVTIQSAASYLHLSRREAIWSKSSKAEATAWVCWRLGKRKPKTTQILHGCLTHSMLHRVSVHSARKHAPRYLIQCCWFFSLTLDFRKNKNLDVLQTLLSIYDSKDLFVKELQVLLAQRLLAVRDYDLDREVSVKVSGVPVSARRHIG
jgi:hypothetical protein